jgi:hypothetical protein
MRRRERRTRLVEPWASVQGAVWLLGLALLFWQGWIWPGILVLIAISVLVAVVARQVSPTSVRGGDQAGAPAPASPSAPVPEHRAELLPTNCPRCGGPTRGAEVKWTGPQSADCPFCGANLPMTIARGSGA